MSTNFQIAKTHLLAKKRQTLVAVLGVTFGIAMYVLMASVMTGVNQFVDELSFQVSPHIRLYKEANVTLIIHTSVIIDGDFFTFLYTSQSAKYKLSITILFSLAFVSGIG